MPIEVLDDRAAGPNEAPDRSRLRWYRETASGKKVFLLRQKGAFTDLCEDHGRALASEIEQGVFPEIVDTIRVDTDGGSDFTDRLFRALFNRIAEDVFTSTGGEFQDAVRALDRGYEQGRPGRKFQFADVLNACVSIDAGNIATGFSRRAEKWGAADANLAALVGFVTSSLRRYPGADADATMADRGRAFGALSRQAGRGGIGMGCTGFTAPPGQTMEGLGLHGRTFDGAFFAWNNVPGLFLVDERRPGRPEIKHRYAAVGTAGLIYPGGISGVNDAGIACSIHQMSTTTYSLGDGGGCEIAPFVQQRILREAATLDEAIAVVKSVGHFASWAILVSDAVAGKAVRIEINGHGGTRPGKPEVAVSEIEDWAVQTNHFRTPEMEERFHHFGDAHFTKSVGKWLETRARQTVATQRLELLMQTDQLDTTEAMQLLASHDDAELGDGAGGVDATRAFGRTICKAYGLMASIARADPDRTRASDEIWFTIGERLPGPHSSFLGFRINWEALDATPVATDPVRVARTVPQKMDAALSDYVDGFRCLARPRIGGEYLGREPTEAELATLRAKALGHFDRGLERAEDERGAPDVTFRYIRARLRHASGQLAQAQADWQVLRQLADSTNPPVPLCDYERALIRILSAATEKALGRTDDLEDLLDQAEANLAQVEGHARSPAGKPHPGLSKWRTVIFRLRDHAGEVDLPDIDFVTVE